MLYLLPFLTAFTNRVRGGLFGTRIPYWGTNAGRLVYAASIAVSLGLHTGHWILAGLNLVTVFLGQAILGYSPWQWMQKKDDMLRMSIRGIIGTGCSAIVAAGVLGVPASLILIATGALMGPVYYVAVHQLPLIPWLSDTEIKDKNDTAEVLYGFIAGIGYALTVVVGG